MIEKTKPQSIKITTILMASLLLTSAALLACSSSKKSTSTAANIAQQQDQRMYPKLIVDPAPDNHPGNDFDELWGQKVPDPYRWLENPDNKGVAEWTKAQHKRTKKALSTVPIAREFANQLSVLMYMASISTPVQRADKLFYTQRDEKAEKSKYYVEENGKSRLLIDPAQFSKDGSIALGMTAPSPNGKLLAYTTKVNNADHATLYIMDVDTGETRKTDVIKGARYADPEWKPDSSGFYYTLFPMDESIPVDKRPGLTTVRYHELGTDPANDPIIKEALNDPTKFHYVEISEDGNWLIYTIMDGWNGNMIEIQNINPENPSPWITLPTQKNNHYHAEIYNNTLYFRTDQNAENFRIIKIPLQTLLDKQKNTKTEEIKTALNANHWQEIIPEKKDQTLQGFAIYGGKLLVNYLVNVSDKIDIYDLDGKLLSSPDIGANRSLGAIHGRNDLNTAYLSTQGFAQAPRISQLDIESGKLTLWKEVKTAAATNLVDVSQHWATSKDGTKIPYFVVRYKNTELNGTAPTILYGYGGFNVAITPGFNPAIYPWLAHGGIYVYANLRGGSEFGEAWHKNGKGMHKQNVFDDFDAVAQSLVEKKITSAKKLAVYGGSNGGLLIGAAITQYPEHFAAAVCAVPLLDMVRYHKFGSGRTWISEYGSVEQSKESFKNILAYSPYHHVTSDKQYPPILFLGADSDDRVDPMHARKMTAAMQDAGKNNNTAIVLLRVEKNAGHGGADLVRSRMHRYVDMYTFIWSMLTEKKAAK